MLPSFHQLKLFYTINLLIMIELYQQKLTLMYYDIGYYGYFIEAHIGTPHQICMLNVDITSPFTRLTQTMYYKNHSLTNIISNELSFLSHHSNHIEGYAITDVINIGNNNHSISTNITFIQIPNNSNYSLPNVLGLSYSFKDIRYSLLHQLYKNDKVPDLSYSFVRFNKAVGGLYLGGIPSDVIINKTSAICNVNPMTEYWDCVIDGIKIEENLYAIKEKNYAYFNMSQKITYAPKAFGDFLYENYLKEFLRKKECKLVKRMTNTTHAICAPDHINNLPNITFVIDRFEYTFRSNQIFNCFDKECELMIAIHENKLQWIFGLFFLKNFDILFSYKENNIHFYSDTIMLRKFNQPYIPQYQRIRNFLFILNISLLISGIIMLSIHKTSINLLK